MDLVRFRVRTTRTVVSETTGALLLFLVAVLLPISAAGSMVSLDYRSQSVGQPLRGMEAKSDSSGTFVWSWLVVTNVMRDRDEFDWTGLESRLEKNSKRGLHTILRPIVDEGSRNTLVPPFLTKIEGATAVDFNGYIVPVYSDPATREALLKFVEAFGARYDGDRRIGFVEVGLLGQWGEGWAPHSNAGRSTEVTPESRDAVYEAYRRCFKKTILLLPRPGTNTWTTPFGFHNEAFALTDRFYQILQDSSPDVQQRWRRSPINARVHPEYASAEKNRNLTFDHITESRILSWIEREHYSCIRLPSGGAMPREMRERFVRTAQRAGYELWVKQLEFEQAGDIFKLRVTVTNTGVAPFYYAWPIELAVLENDRATRSRSTSWDIRRVIPGDGDVVYESMIDTKDLPAASRTLLLRIPNPLPKGPPIRFANRAQDQHVDGWLSLGDLTEQQ